MKTVTAIRHVHFEDLGSFGDLLAERGWSVSYLDAGVDDLSAFDAEADDLLVVLGGPIGAYEDDLYPFLRHELNALERRLAAARPTLGICLGAQLMARTLGARVYPGSRKEIGWAPLELAAEPGPLGALNGEPVLHWHGDTFDLPPGAERLASTPITANQAFRRGTALGLQFHPEVLPAHFERWLIGHAAEIAQTDGVSVPALRADTVRFGGGLVDRARAAFGRWLDGQGL